MLAIKQPQGWQAGLELGFTRHRSRTVLSRRCHKGPLTVQRPFYPEGDVCHLYLLHPPGGVVGGDKLEINVALDQGASALLTTPGASKFYRSNVRSAEQIQRLSIADNASLEWLPQENIIFRGACAQLRTEIHLADKASLIAWEIQCLGRPACKEIFDLGTAEFSFSIFRNTVPLMLDRLAVENHEDLDSISRLRGFPVIASLYATGVDTELLNRIQQDFSDPPRAVAGFTLVDDLLICRLLGHSSEQARELLIQIWTLIRPQSLRRTACPPRIWST